MRFSSLVSATLLVFSTGPAVADCIVCNEIVEIDTARADCFLENHGAIADAVAKAPEGRKSIDLDACTIDGEALGSRGSIINLPRIDGESNDEPRSKAVYLLDSVYVDCLKSLIEGHGGPFDPAETFDLFDLCER